MRAHVGEFGERMRITSVGWPVGQGDLSPQQSHSLRHFNVNAKKMRTSVKKDRLLIPEKYISTGNQVLLFIRGYKNKFSVGS